MADKIIDDRLLDANCQEKIEENFNRVLDMIESGGSGGGGTGGVFVVKVTETDGVTTADKTFAEIADAFENGMTVVVHQNIGSSDQPIWQVLRLDVIEKDIVSFKSLAFVANSGVSQTVVSMDAYSNLVDVQNPEYSGSTSPFS